MPRPGPRDLDADVRAVAGRLVDQLDSLLPRLGATYQAEIEGYARLSDDQLRSQVLATSRRLIGGYFGCIAEGRDAARVDLGAMTLVGRRRLEMGLSLDDALHAFRLAAREVWSALAASLRPGEEAALVALAAGWIDRIDQVSSRVAEGYLTASHDHLRRVDARRSAIVDALLRATDDGEVAAVGERFAIVIAARYRPVVLAGPDVLLRGDLLVQRIPEALVGRRGDRLLALLPEDVEVDPDTARAVAHAELTTAGRAVRPGAALLVEVEHTDALVAAAMRAGHRHGVFGPGDLQIERMVVAAGTTAHDVAAAVLGALRAVDSDGKLVTTLARYLATGSIPTVAAELEVHPNTVAHRLRRVRQLTGLDPKVPRDSSVLVLATAVTETVGR